MKDLILDMYPRMVSYIRNILGKGDTEMAEDIFYDVLTAFLEKKAEINADKVQGYVFHSIRNACINYLSRQSTERLSIPFSLMSRKSWESICDAEFETDASKEIPDAGKPDIREIMDFAYSLPPRTREAFLLTRIEGRSLKDTADAMGISVRAVQKHITISITRFRERFPEAV